MRHDETFRLAMGDVDAFGIVFFARYWEWYEQAFEGLFAAGGHPFADLIAGGVGLPLVHAEIDYRQPLRLGDLVTAGIALRGVGGRSCRFETVFSDQEGRITAVAATVHVAAKIGMGPTPLPGWMSELVEPEAGNAAIHECAIHVGPAAPRASGG